MKAWILASWAGMPRWGWALIVTGIVAETVLGRSKDPRFRSLGDSIRNVLALVLSMIPFGGPLLVRLLQAIFVLPKPAVVAVESEKTTETSQR